MADRHRCLACTDLVVDDGAALLVPERFSGPPGLANGGVVVGALTCIARRASAEPAPTVAAVHARLTRGVPVGRRLAAQAVVDADGLVEVTLTDGDDLLVTAAVRVVGAAETAGGLAPTLIGLERLEPLLEAVAPIGAPAGVPARRPRADPDPFDRCFVCGPGNEAGLRIAARPTGPTTAVAAVPELSRYIEADGRLDTVAALAALDCPATGSFLHDGGIVDDDETVLLGTFEAELLRRPTTAGAGGYRVTAHLWRREGRRLVADTALLDGDDRPCALAVTTWVTVPRTDVAAR